MTAFFVFVALAVAAGGYGVFRVLKAKGLIGQVTSAAAADVSAAASAAASKVENLTK